MSPYIPKPDRVPLEMSHHASTPGELNYLLTITALDYLDHHKLSYKTLSEVVAAFECAKLEFVRRVVEPYEASKMRQAGDLEQYDHYRRVIA